MPGPLDGLFRILDLSERSPSSAIASMIFSDLGAEVIRVEPEGGDPVRTLSGHRVWFRGQKSVTVGPEQENNGQWAALRDSADAILTTAQPWTSKPDGLLAGYPNNERQILCVLTALPRSIEEVKGPRHGTDHPVYGELVEAEYGMPHLMVGNRPGPIFQGWPQATYGAAWMIELGILGALLERERTGRGQILTTSLLDGAAILANMKWTAGKNIGDPIFVGPGSRLRTIISLLQCSDGVWVQVHTGARGSFDTLMKIVGRPELAEEVPDPHTLARQLPQEVADELWAYLQATFKQKSSQYWQETLSKADVSCMPALSPGNALWLKQVELNGLVDIAPDGRRQLGKLVKYARTPIEVSRDIPAAGQHNAELLGSGAHRISATPTANGHTGKAGFAPGAKRVGPLDGTLVLDFGVYMAGPFANRIFADLGARVIKIEEWGGDPLRGPQLGSHMGTWRGKESFPVNLKTDEGRKVVHQLVKRADIVHYNTRIGAMGRLGMGYDELVRLNPRLIVCHSSGYGNEGEWARLPTFEPLHSALSGMLSRTGGEGNKPGYYLSNMDFGCGLTSAAMCIAALIERERSGIGQFLEVPQIGAGLLGMSDVWGYQDRKFETFPLDRDQRGHAPTNAMYRTSDGLIVIACCADAEWQGVWRGLGLSATAWPSYETARQEPFGHSAIARTVEEAIGKLTTADAERRLRGEGVPCVVPRPLSANDLVKEPMLRSLGVIVEETHRTAGLVYEVGHTIRFGNQNAIHTRVVPVLGQDTVAILRELGKSESEIDALIDARIVNAGDRKPSRSEVEAEKHA